METSEMEEHPVAIWFVERPSEYLAFVGRMLQIAALAYSFGLGAVELDKPNEICSAPGLWVQYSDNAFLPMGHGRAVS